MRLCFRLASLAGVTLAAVTVAEAQTQPPRHRHASTQSDGERQITVHKSTKSWLTAGGQTTPAVTSPNNYVLDTFSPPNPTVNTAGGWHGQESIPIGRFDGPGIPVIRFW